MSQLDHVTTCEIWVRQPISRTPDDSYRNLRTLDARTLSSRTLSSNSSDKDHFSVANVFRKQVPVTY